MTKSLYCILLFIASFSINFNHLNASSFQFDNLLIEYVNIIMMELPENSGYDTRSIQARMKSKPGELFSQASFDADLKTLIVDFDRIEPILDPYDDKLTITLKIWLKPTIHSITWLGNHKVKTSKLNDELDIKCGTLFDRLGFNQAFHKLKTYYVQQGFFEAELGYEVYPIEGTNQVDIQINIQEGRAGVIKKIVFENFSEAEIEELNEEIVTKEYFFLTSWLTNEGTYQEQAILQDEFTILDYLHNEGYADARVDIQVCEFPQDNRIVVKIIADKGPRYAIGNITFKGNTLFNDEEILKCFAIRQGGRYSPELIRATQTCITNYYGKFGYIDAVVDYEPRLSECGYVYDIDITIEEGEKYRVGLIKVFGNCTTQTRVILNETLLVPGEVFNLQKLKRTEARLVNIGFFKSVNVYAVKSDGACGNYRDVHIEVEEAPTGHFGAFFGFSTTEEIFGGFTLTETNFNYKGLGQLREKGFSALRGGGEYSYFTATIGSKSRSYVLSWNKPFVCDTLWVVGFDIDKSSNRYIADDYDFESAGFKLHADYPMNIFLRAGCYYRLKYSEINISDSEEDKAEDIVNDPNKSQHKRRLSEQLLEEQSNSGLISGVGVKLVYDSTNRPNCPTSGFKSRFDAECIGVGGKHNWLGFAYVNTYYFQLLPYDQKGVFRVRANFRFLQPYAQTKFHTIPLDERLFLGGEDYVRGYRPYRLGPKYPGQDPRGGVSLQYYSAEYSFPVFKWLEAFVFGDAGHLSLKYWNFGRLDVAVGYGAHLNIIPSMPPLTVGWGFPLNARDHSDVKQFFLSLGGNF